MKKHLIVVCLLAAFMGTLAVTSAHAQTPDSLTVPAQAFTRRQPSSPPLPASHRFVTQQVITRTFPLCYFLTNEDLKSRMSSAIGRYFPMEVRIHNPDGKFKFSNPTPTAAQCAEGLVKFKADGVFTRPGIRMNRSIGFSVRTEATVTYIPRSARSPLAIVKRAIACPTSIKVHDSDVMQQMKDVAQMQLHHNVRSKASCINIAREVYTYVQKGGRL